VLLFGVTVVLWATSDAAGTSSRPADEPIVAPPAATGVPEGVAEVWRAPSGATALPVVAGPAVVTGDGGRVVGRDAATGEERWSYERDRPLCTVAAGFPRADDGRGRVLALYAEGSDWCSELTALRPDTGARAAAGNPDVRPGTRLVASESSVLATGERYLEVMRSDLVKTLEYGDVPVPVQVGEQPRPDCTHASHALGSGRLGIVERCPGEGSDRLTLAAADGDKGAEEPQVDFSVLLPGTGAVVVAVSAERVAVALPGPSRLLVYDHSGRQVGEHPLDAPESDLADPPGGVVATTTRDHRVTWWTGSHTVALDGGELSPLWNAPDTLGPAVGYADAVLVPVAGGLRVLDPATGAELRTIAVERPPGPVRLEALGEMLLEQRGGELVALRPT
jgi:hypothetical protein